MLTSEYAEWAGREMDISETNEDDNTPNMRIVIDQESHHKRHTKTTDTSHMDPSGSPPGRREARIH